LLVGSRTIFGAEQRKQHASVLAGIKIDDVGRAGRFSMGRVQKRCGQAALACLEHGAELLGRGEVSALVTAPVSKETLRLAGFRWPGQTEFLAERLGAKRYAMLAWTRTFKAAFVTIHLPLARVARQITAPAVAGKVVLLDEFLRLEGNPEPRIGVMALNPHGGEFSLGEEARIAEGIRRARRRGIDADGPFPADTLVGRAGFDGLVAMYHDQAMIPAKLSGGGVNVTLGLGRIRTSPLHGTAFDIAGRGQARPDSMIAAIRLARRTARR
jgi:4-hydroxythreonine-4-phosphate dehydrogenase